MTVVNHRPDAQVVAGVLDRIRTQQPLVHCLTNVVVTNWTANVLLAVGASPAMVENPEEAGQLATAAGGLLVNLGTMSADRAEAARAATDAARAAGTPWVLDPVAVGVLDFRSALAAELLDRSPAVVRGNPSEVVALAGGASSARGVDSAAQPADADDAARSLLARGVGAVAVSGAVDRVTDHERVVEVPLGHPWLARVTGTGCALGALVGAALAVGAGPLEAGVAATTVLTVAAEVATPDARGTGSFAVGLLDALTGLDDAALGDRLRR